MKVSFMKSNGENVSYTVDGIVIDLGEKDVEMVTENVGGRKKLIVREVNINKEE